MSKRKCPNCNKSIQGHPNKKFCNSRCKDRYWNRVNPRGFAGRDPWDDDTARDMEDAHPFSSEGLGQWAD